MSESEADVSSVLEITAAALLVFLFWIFLSLLPVTAGEQKGRGGQEHLRMIQSKIFTCKLLIPSLRGVMDLLKTGGTTVGEESREV